MAEKADAPAEGALVKDSYYHDGARWERDKRKLHGNAARVAAQYPAYHWTSITTIVRIAKAKTTSSSR